MGFFLKTKWQNHITFINFTHLEKYRDNNLEHHAGYKIRIKIQNQGKYANSHNFRRFSKCLLNKSDSNHESQ